MLEPDFYITSIELVFHVRKMPIDTVLTCSYFQAQKAY